MIIPDKDELPVIDQRDIRRDFDIRKRPFELIALHTLIHNVPETYKPQTPVISMAACCGDHTSEGTMIRKFHQERFGIEDVVVIGCERFSGSTLKHATHDDYDLKLSEADASDDIPWLQGIAHAYKQHKDDKRRTYDHIHFNHPNVNNWRSWIHIFIRAYEFLTPETGIMTLHCYDDEIFPSDQLGLKKMAALLKREGINVSPIKSFMHVDSELDIENGLISFAYVQKS